MVQRWGPRFDMEGDMERALLHWTRENGYISSHVSMHQVLALIFLLLYI